MRAKLIASVPGRHGFTLVELMVVVTISAILLSIAVPTYRAQVRKSRRTEAKTALLDLASREERYMSTNNAYSNTAADLGYSSLPTVVGGGYYQLSVPAAVASTSTAPASFTAAATVVSGSGQEKDTSCVSFTVDSTGKQTSLDSLGANSSGICWK
jgi:type IV pilus assembly protein PilE